VGYFGRPADPTGLAFYANNYLNAAAPTNIVDMSKAYATNPGVKALIDSFGTSAESQALYPGDNATFLTAIYHNLFNRDPDAKGLSFWVSVIDSGAVTRPNAVLALMGGAQGSDVSIIENKATAASNFTRALNTPAFTAAYSGMEANAVLRNMLTKVGLSPDDVSVFQSNVNVTLATLVQLSLPGRFAPPAAQSGTNPLLIGFRAVNFTVWSNTGWADASLYNQTLDYVKSLGANTIVLDWTVAFGSDGHLAANYELSAPTLKNVANVIAAAKSRGLYVILKPHVISDQCCGQNRNATNTDLATFLPANFFVDWRNYLLQAISALPVAQVDAITIGTEMNMLDWRNRSDWLDLISTVRGKYSGLLTYDGMFSQYSGSKDCRDVVFWDKLDFVSCSFYVRLSSDDNASVATLASLMQSNPSVERTDAIGALRALSITTGKKVFALEGGYQSSNGALWNVNDDFGPNGVVNQSLQANGFEAYLRSLAVYQGNWLMGVSLWDIQDAHLQSWGQNDPNFQRGWGFVGKQAEQVIRNWYTLH
jgi:aryl-phospho-beta-D-glucosidase BglC (GH1 family)